MKLKSKKMLFICLLFLAFIILNGKTSFAAEYPDIPDNVKEVMQGKYYMIFKDYGANTRILISNKVFFVTMGSDGRPSNFYGQIGSKMFYAIYYFDRGYWFIDNEYTCKSSNPLIVDGISYAYFPDSRPMIKFHEANFDIWRYDFDSSGNITYKHLYYKYEPPIPTVNPTLYIDDQNLRKRFKFEFEIPLRDENTKYYVFLQKYTRNSYDSVTATFSIYTVDTPEGYDASNYENYMYYDLPSKRLFLPAGTNVKWYSTTVNNGKKAELGLISDFIASRKSFTFGDKLTQINLLKDIIPDNMTYDDSLSYLFPTSSVVENFSLLYTLSNILGSSTFVIDGVTRSNVSVDNFVTTFGFSSFSQFFYSSVMNVLYYSREEYLYLPFEDLAFSNYNILSYENVKNDFEKNGLFYNLFRKTRVYNQENKIDDVTFAFNYSDGQDVSSLLPSDVDKGYLTSPWYKDNENSSSKGNITYDIKEILQGDKLIDYSKTDNSIHNNFYGDYIEKFEEGDNITINNYYTQVIDKTSDNNLLHNIYVAILEIKQILSNTNDKISNTTNNFTYNINNTVTFLFVPSNVAIKGDLEKVDTSAKEHLGIVYEPFDMLIYTITLFTNLDNSSEIVLSAPAVVWKEHEIIPATHFSFNEFFELAPEFKNIHDIYLMSVDFTVVGLLLYFAYKKFKEVFNK